MSDDIRFAGVTGIAETSEAVLVDMGDEQVWIPKSQICDDSEVWGKGHEGALIITEWLAIQKGLI